MVTRSEKKRALKKSLNKGIEAAGKFLGRRNPGTLLAISGAVAGVVSLFEAGQTARAGMFDTNSTTAGFGVVDTGSYDWLGGNLWSTAIDATGDAGTAVTAPWVSGTPAYFVGAGTGTNYTVRLGTTGTSNTNVGNIAINVKADGSAALTGAAGDVTIGNVGDTGVLTVNANNSVGAQGGGTLTINNGMNLNAKTMNFRGGNVVINGVVSGTGASKIAFGSGFFGLTAGTLTLANTANTYAGRVNSDYIGSNYTLAVTKLANGGSNSSIGTSSANIGINGGTLKYIGSTGAQSTNLGLHIASGGATIDASGITSSDTISISGTPTYSAGNQVGAITLTGANTGANTMGFVYGDNGTGKNTLTKNGGGTWVINQNNTFTGAVNVNAGTLRVTKSGSLGTGTKTVAVIGSTWLELDGTAGDISFASGLTFRISGNSVWGIKNIAGNNTINGGINLHSGAGNGLVTVTGGTMTLAGTVQATTTGGRSLTLNGTTTGNLVSGQIIDGSSTVSIIKDGVGTWTLSSANTYTGNTLVTNGTLKLTNNDAIKNSAFDTSGAGTLDLTDASINTLTMGGLIGDASTGKNLVLPSNVTSLTLNPTVSTVTNTYVKNISGGATGLTLTKSGAGTQVLSGTNSYTGATSISAGVLSITTAAALGNTSGVVITSTGNPGGVLELANGVTVSGKSITISGYGNSDVRGSLRAAAGATAEWAGPVTIGGTGSPADTRVGAMANGTLTISGKISNGTGNNLMVSADGATGKVIVSGANDYTGQTQIVRGTLALGANNSLPIGTVLNVHAASSVTDPAVFELNNYNQQVAGLLRGATNGGVTGTATVTNSSGTTKTLTISNTSNYTYDSAITGNLALVKDGTATQTLSGTNSYSGGTTIQAGTLEVTKTGDIDTSAALVQMDAGATFIRGIASGTTLANDLKTQITTDLNSTAEILAGTAGADRSVSMSWRLRNSGGATGEMPNATGATTFPTIHPFGGLASDVVTLGGTSSDTFVMQMSYSEAEMAKILGFGADVAGFQAAETSLATNKLIDLGWLNGSGAWVNAVEGNTSFVSLSSPVLKSYQQFITDGGSMTLNTWGVDTTSNTVWAVVDHGGSFASVPEPGSLSLLGMGVLALMGSRRRKPKKSAGETALSRFYARRKIA